jgi:hypothetical protein
VTSGQEYCSIDADGCVTDGDGQHAYEGASCEVKVLVAGELSSEGAFELDEYGEHIHIGNKFYPPRQGRSGPKAPSKVSVDAGSTFKWSSSSLDNRLGWKLCLTPPKCCKNPTLDCGTTDWVNDSSLIVGNDGVEGGSCFVERPNADLSFDVSKEVAGSFGTADFRIEMDVAGTGDPIYTGDDSMGCLFIRSASTGSEHNWRGPAAFIYESGSLKFGLSKDEQYLYENALGWSPQSRDIRHLVFSRTGNTLEVLVNGTPVSGFVSNRMREHFGAIYTGSINDVDLAGVREAPLRFRGSKEDQTVSTLRMDVSDVKFTPFVLSVPVDADSCTCIYPNGNVPPRQLLPSYTTPSPPVFTLINSAGMALGLRPNVGCDSGNDLSVETQVSDPNAPRQRFQLTHEGQLVSVRCPNKVLTALAGAGDTCDGSLQMLQAEPSDRPSLQKWTFNHDEGTLLNIGCPNLAISSNKEASVSLHSTHFALLNPRTQLAIGVVGDSCEPGMPIQVQKLSYGSPNQQFVYNEDDGKIVSVLCPDYAVEVPDADCTSKAVLHLSNEGDHAGDGRNQWSFDREESAFENTKCKEMFITMGLTEKPVNYQVETDDERLSVERTTSTLKTITDEDAQAIPCGNNKHRLMQVKCVSTCLDVFKSTICIILL